jgi:hypothetical protein
MENIPAFMNLDDTKNRYLSIPHVPVSMQTTVGCMTSKRKRSFPSLFPKCSRIILIWTSYTRVAGSIVAHEFLLEEMGSCS